MATTGSDDAAGSIDAPLKTIQAAVDASGPGDTVIVRGGVYAPFSIGLASQPDAPFTVRGADGETAVIQGEPGTMNTIRIRGTAASVVVQGLTVTGTTGYRSAGILVETVTGGPVDLRDLVVTDNAGFGIDLYESTQVVVENSQILHNGTGIVAIREGAGVVIRRNDIHDNDQMIRDTPTPNNDDYGAEGVSLVGTTGALLVTDNRIWGNRAPSFDYVWDGGAFSIFGASNATISDNLIWDNENVLEAGTDGTACAGNQFVRNVAWGDTSAGRSWGMFLRCGQGMLVAHNTIVGLEAFVFSLGDDNSAFAGSIAGMRIEDNIVAVSHGTKVFGLPALTTLPADISINYDLISNPGGPLATVTARPTLGDLGSFQQATGFEANGISGDPMFQDAGNADYRLTAQSPAIDRAAPIPGLDEPFSGAAPDIGRWEFVPGS